MIIIKAEVNINGKIIDDKKIVSIEEAREEVIIKNKDLKIIISKKQVKYNLDIYIEEELIKTITLNQYPFLLRTFNDPFFISVKYQGKVWDKIQPQHLNYTDFVLWTESMHEAKHYSKRYNSSYRKKKPLKTLNNQWEIKLNYKNDVIEVNYKIERKQHAK